RPSKTLPQNRSSLQRFRLIPRSLPHKESTSVVPKIKPSQKVQQHLHRYFLCYATWPLQASAKSSQYIADSTAKIDFLQKRTAFCR
ncbi:hypothetical protein ACWKW1_27745, partial [Brevibacillus parabrevis]